jgi:putative transcriptional regulator
LLSVKAHKPGQRVLRTPKFTPPPPQKIRAKLKISQAAFARLMGVSLSTVQEWEQLHRKPSEPAEALLRIAEQPSKFSHSWCKPNSNKNASGPDILSGLNSPALGCCSNTANRGYTHDRWDCRTLLPMGDYWQEQCVTDLPHL